MLDVAYTYAEDCDKPVYRGYLKTCYTCKIPSSEESHIEKNHLENTNQILNHITAILSDVTELIISLAS